MGEAIEQLELRIEKLAEAREFAFQHRNYTRDAELRGELEKLKAQRSVLVELERVEQQLGVCVRERRDAAERRQWDVSKELNRQINALREERSALRRRIAENRVAHLCHARGCSTAVDPRLLMCAPHWRLVPRALQLAVWRSYRRGQELRKDPSREYVEAARAAIEAVAQREQQTG